MGTRSAPCFSCGVTGKDQSKDSQGNWEEGAGGQGRASSWG